MSAEPGAADFLSESTLAELDALDPVERRSVARYLTADGPKTGASFATRVAQTVRGDLVEIRRRDGFVLAVVDHQTERSVDEGGTKTENSVDESGTEGSVDEGGTNVVRALYRVRLEPQPTGRSSVGLTYLGRIR